MHFYLFLNDGTLLTSHLVMFDKGKCPLFLPELINLQ